MRGSYSWVSGLLSVSLRHLTPNCRGSDIPHTPYPPSRRLIADILAFLIIFFRARRPAMRFPGIPSLLDTILRGASVYFVLVFTCQVLLVFFLLFTSVSDVSHVRVGDILKVLIVCVSSAPNKVHAWSVGPSSPWLKSYRCVVDNNLPLVEHSQFLLRLWRHASCYP
jgi:hypothetical protein